jgi:hypothetical protein
MADSARVINSGFRVNLSMQFPGIWRWLFLEVSGERDVGGNTVFPGDASISVYPAQVGISVSSGMKTGYMLYV